VKFVVRWKQDASDELASIWLDAESSARGRITTSAREIDRLLQTNPYGQGESREADLRVMFVPPLAASFRVIPRVDKVEVLRIWQFK
jgi:plasmid stabilization system protein ParE